MVELMAPSRVQAPLWEACVRWFACADSSRWQRVGFWRDSADPLFAMPLRGSGAIGCNIQRLLRHDDEAIAPSFSQQRLSARVLGNKTLFHGVDADVPGRVPLMFIDVTGMAIWRSWLESAPFPAIPAVRVSGLGCLQPSASRLAVATPARVAVRNRMRWIASLPG